MNKKKTILYIGGFELPDKNAAAHRVLNNAKIIKKMGYNVVFIGITKDKKIIENKCTDIQGFESWVIKYPETKLEWMGYLLNFKKIKKVLDIYNSLEAVIAYNYQSGVLYQLKNYCKKNNIKIIADCTEWYDAKGNGCAFYILKSIDSYLRMNIIQPKLDGLIVISEYLEKYYSKYLVKISNIPPLVDKNEKKWELNKLNFDNDKLKLVYAGSPGKQKDNLRYVIEAFKNIDRKKYEFKILGITYDAYIRDNSDHIELLEKLKENIYFLGRVDHLKALEFVKIADFNIFIRDINRVTLAGFPTKFVESLSCGTPVITNNSSDLEKYLFNNVNGFLIKGDIKKNIEKIISQDSKILKKLKSNTNLNINQFDYNNYIDEMKKIF